MFSVQHYGYNYGYDYNARTGAEISTTQFALLGIVIGGILFYIAGRKFGKNL